MEKQRVAADLELLALRATVGGLLAGQTVWRVRRAQASLERPNREPAETAEKRDVLVAIMASGRLLWPPSSFSLNATRAATRAAPT